MYDLPLTLPGYAIHDTILVMTISWKGQHAVEPQPNEKCTSDTYIAVPTDLSISSNLYQSIYLAVYALVYEIAYQPVCPPPVSAPLPSDVVF